MALNITPYQPTAWVNDSEPDIDDTGLNKIEQGIKSAVDGVNAIVAALTSQIADDPNKFASIAALYAVNQSLNNLSNTVTTLNSNLTTLNNKILLDSSYLVIKQVALPSGSSGNDWVNVSLSQMNISGKKIPDICAPMACISWNVGTAFWVTYCTKYDDTTLQVRFNSPISTAFRVTLMFELVNAS